MAVNWGSFLGRLRNKAIQQAPQTPQRTLQVTQSAPRKLAVTPTKQRQAPIPVSGAAPKITPQELVQISVLKLQQDSRKNPANKAANAAKINALLSNQGVKAGSSYETLRPKSVSDNVVSLLGGLAEFNPVRQVGSAGQFGGQVLETNPRVSKVGRFLQKASKPLAAFGDTKDTVADARLITNPAVKQVRKLVEFAGQTSNLALPGGLLINSAGQFGKTGTSTVEDLEAKGVSRKDAVKKAVPNAILQGAVEAVSSKFELSGRAKNIFIKAIINANVEGGEEAVQQLLDNAFKNNKLNEGVLEAYATGAVLGGVSSPIYSRLGQTSPPTTTQSRGSRKRTPASGIFAPSGAQGVLSADTGRTSPVVGTEQISSRNPINKGILTKSRDIIKGIVDFNTQLGQGGYVKVPTSTSAVASRLPVRLETNTKPSPQNPKVQQRPLQTPSTNTQTQADPSIKLKKGESAYVPAQDRRTLIDAIDHARGVLNLSEDSSIELQARAAEIAQKYGILQGKEPATFEKFADKIDQYLARTKQQDYDYVPERRGAGILKKIKEYNSKMGQGGYLRVPGQKTQLMVTHNLSPDNLAHANRLGGIPQASIGIVNPEVGAIEGYGDITLVGNQKLVDPKAPKTQTYNSDIYSPRQPRADFMLDGLGKAVEARFSNIMQQTGDKTWNYDSEDVIASLSESPTILASFLEQNRITPEIDTTASRMRMMQNLRDQVDRAGIRDSFDAYVLNLANEMGAERKLFAGFTPSGNRRYLPETMDNTLKLMRKDKLQGGETFGGSGKIRAMASKRFNTLQEIVDNKGSLVSSAEMENIKNNYEDLLPTLANKLEPFVDPATKSENQFTEYDNIMESISDYMAGDLTWFNQKFKNVPTEVLSALDQAKETFKNMPTEYFESVADRAVQLREFEKALVPENTSQEVIQILNDAGIQPIFYKPGERQKMLAMLMKDDNIERFARGPSKAEGGYVKVPGGGDNKLVKLPVRKQNDSNGGTTETINPDPSPEGVPSNGVKKVKLRDKIFRSTRSIIERQGKFGKKLADNLQKARDFEEVMQAQIMEGLPTVRSLKGKDFENFIEATQNGGSSDPKIQQAVNEWQAVHPKIREAGVNVGLDIGDLGPEYYPHFIDYELIFKDRSKYNEALNHLVQTGQAKDIADAIKKLSYARDVSRNRRFGNLESSRLIDLPFYDKTRNSLTSYIQGSTRRISQAAVFGKDDSKALDLIARATEEGYDGESMKNAYDVAVGAKQYNPNSKEASRKVRGYISTTRLGLGAITNTSQSVNTGIVTGHLRTLKSMVAQLDPKNREFVRKTGVVSDAIINDLREQQGFIGKTLGKITAPGFSQVEKFNRSVAAVAGRQYAMSLAKKGKVNTLRKLGVTGDIGTQLTEGQLIQAARKVVEKTQFKVDPQDLPGWVDTPWGRVVSQFRTFSYSQSKFVSNEILKPLAKGNVMPLSRFLAALPVGYALAEIKRLINNRPEEENKLRKDIEAVSNIGGLGLVMDIYRGMVPLNNKYLSSDRRVSMAVSTFGGPTAGTAAELVGAVSEVAQKKKLPKNPADMDNKVALGIDESGYRDATQLTRLGLRQIPIIGSRLQNTFVPYKPKSEKEKAAEASQPGLLDRIFGVKKADAGTEDKAEAARESETRLSAIKERQKSGQKLTALESDKLYWSMVDKLAKNQGKYMGMEPELSGELIRNARITPQARAKRYDDINNYLRLQVAQTAYKKSQKTITDKQEADKLRSLIKYDVALKNKINSVEALKEWQKTDEGKYKIELALFEHDKPNLTEAEIVKRTEKLNRIQNKSKPKAKKARLSKKSKVKSPKVKKLSLGTIRTSKIRSPRMKVKKVSYKKARKLPVKTA